MSEPSKSEPMQVPSPRRASDSVQLWVWPRECRAVVELQRPEVELAVLYGDGRTRAAWLSPSGVVLWWAAVGSC